MELHLKEINSTDIGSSSIRRLSRIPDDLKPDDFEDKFDATTLWYDAIQDGSFIFLVCPRLNNLTENIRQGLFFGDSNRLRRLPSINLPRTTIIVLWSGKPVSQVSFQSNSISVSSAVHQAEHSLSHGLNCSLSINKNNDLRWIADHVSWHVKYHGLDAYFLLENQSDAYTTDEIVDALSGCGLKKLVILSLPLSYGPKAQGKYRHWENFLQTSAYNILKLRFLKHARAVLSCDIDELVWPGEESIFQTARKSPMGFVQFSGQTCYQDILSTPEVSHRAGYYLRPGERDAAYKWCLVPNSWLRYFYWSTHSLSNFRTRDLFVNKKRSYGHFYHVSTGWKSNRRQPVKYLVQNDALKDLLSKSFP